MVKTGFIYKLVCTDIEIKECYVGSTENFRLRKSSHKTKCQNENSKGHNYSVYQFIRDNGGFQNWDMVQVEEFKFDNRRELNARERHWIETLQATLNKVVPNRTQKEYQQYNTEHLKQKANEKHDCLCGGKYTHAHISAHAQTTKHQTFENFMKMTLDELKALYE